MRARETRIAAVSPETMKDAVGLLSGGDVVAIPTETVYGLAANALDEVAVGKIYDAKGRPGNNPLIVHVSCVDEARELVADWPREAEALAEAFWPGPLTLVLSKRAGMVPDITTAGGNTVAVRCPDHPVALELIRQCGFPLAAPSANRSNHISPTTAEHVLESLGGRIPLILDGGPCRAGIESTVVMLSKDEAPVILRPGSILAEEISEVLGREVRERAAGAERSVVGATPMDGGAVLNEEVFLSPGLQQTHYSPTTPLVLVKPDDLDSFLGQMGMEGKRVGVLLFSGMENRGEYIYNIMMPRDAENYAFELYSALYRLDGMGLDVLVCEMPPEGTEWVAVRDRLVRAGCWYSP